MRIRILFAVAISTTILFAPTGLALFACGVGIGTFINELMQ